jgi:tetratricopeptide (TPR) repeat protein
MTGDNNGEYWLKKAKTVEDPLEKAWYHGLAAEVAKSKGLKQEALAEIEEAIATIDAQTFDAKDSYLAYLRRLAYRQDRARIYQYLFYEYAKAREEYEKLQDDLGREAEAHLLAAVRRNYSECLRSMAPSQDDPDWKRAKDIIDEEIDKLADDPEVPIYAELLYERARIALEEGDRPKADDCLQSCLAAAERSHFEMIRAIAKARRFWEFDAFDLDEWRRIESQLNIHHRHGWAERSAMNGRLRAAKRIEGSAPAAALGLLRRNVARTKANPSFDGRSDRDRIARSYAGLMVVGRDPGQWDSFMQTIGWAKEWVEEDASRNPTELWKGVH